MLLWSRLGRVLLVDRILVQGLRAEEAAYAIDVSVRTSYKWLKRFKEEGPEGLVDRSSRTRCCLHVAPQGVVGLRRLARRLAIRHLRTRSYTPHTNGKVE
ncbi:leucine zipper domain-containing protein [Pseudomonas aeruginosa]|uniref:leucine zipper domain-containing protein n=1 Tax=Pseudomonas aeruginosa TaxID=287 RepID=UPI003AC2FB0A